MMVSGIGEVREAREGEVAGDAVVLIYLWYETPVNSGCLT